MQIKQTIRNKVLSTLCVASLGLINACGSATSGDAAAEESSLATETTNAFPSNLAVASPVSVEEASASSTSSALIKAATGDSFIPTYASYTSAISTILTSSSSASCTFDPEDFLARDDDADCFGPIVVLEGHPDWTAAEVNWTTDSGSLPPGDVGLWQETDNLGHACSVGELNARVNGMSKKSQASLEALASLICVLGTSGYSMPSESTQSLTTEMNALGLADVTFTDASITHATNADGDAQYTYVIDLEYVPASTTYDINAQLDHIPGAASDEHTGRMTYWINDDFGTTGNCTTSDITNQGSLLYQSVSATEMNMEVRTASVCDHDTDITVDGLVDATASWGNNFGLFIANFDPSDMQGNYSYTWQAGTADDHTRIFNIVVDEDGSTGYPIGTSFYGYGDDVATSGFDGGVEGFICNWAGPNRDHTYLDFAQYQDIAFDATTGLYTATDSNIAYAPTTSCEYDGMGSFTYDSDADGIVDTDVATAITHDLLGLTDADGDLVWDEVSASGFTTPVAPANF